MGYDEFDTTADENVDVNFMPERNYHTDVVTNMICKYYYNEISKEEAVARLSTFNPYNLAEYILDAFDERKLTSSNIEMISAEE